MLEWNRDRFIPFYRQAKKKDLEERIYMQWCGMLPSLVKYMSFDEFYDQMTGANIDLRPTEEIIKELEELHHVKIAF